MQVVSFINMKGGVGKTTLAVNVAYALAYVHKQQVLIVDCDPQFNATQHLLETELYLAHVSDPKKGTLTDIFMPKRAGRINTVKGSARAANKSRMPLSACTCAIFDGGAGRGKLDLIPSNLTLMEIEESRRLTEVRLKNFLKERAAGYDYVIIDCPPTISVFTQAAVLASDKYVVPIKPDPLSVLGLPTLERALEEYAEDAGMQIEQVGLVFTLVRGPTPSRMKEIMEELRRKRKRAVFNQFMSQSTDVAKSVEAHQPVFLFKPSVRASVQALEITQEFLERTSGA